MVLSPPPPPSLPRLCVLHGSRAILCSCLPPWPISHVSSAGLSSAKAPAFPLSLEYDLSFPIP